MDIITFDKITGEIESTKTLSDPRDILLNVDQSKFDWVVNDGGIENPIHYHYKDGKIERKTQAVIDKQEEDKKAEQANRREPKYLKSDENIMSEIMAEYINELRDKAGITGIITAESIKAELETRRELHRNPKKK